MEEGIFNTHVIKGVKQVRKETTNRKIGQKKKKRCLQWKNIQMIKTMKNFSTFMREIQIKTRIVKIKKMHIANFCQACRTKVLFSARHINW